MRSSVSRPNRCLVFSNSGVSMRPLPSRPVGSRHRKRPTGIDRGEVRQLHPIEEDGEQVGVDPGRQRSHPSNDPRGIKQPAVEPQLERDVGRASGLNQRGKDARLDFGRHEGHPVLNGCEDQAAKAQCQASEPLDDVAERGPAETPDESLVNRPGFAGGSNS